MEYLNFMAMTGFEFDWCINQNAGTCTCNVNACQSMCGPALLFQPGKIRVRGGGGGFTIHTCIQHN